MDWFIEYLCDETEHVEWHSHYEEAIEAACRRLDAGLNVTNIGHWVLGETSDKETIAHLYANWLRVKRPFSSPSRTEPTRLSVAV